MPNISADSNSHFADIPAELAPAGIAGGLPEASHNDVKPIAGTSAESSTYPTGQLPSMAWIPASRQE